MRKPDTLFDISEQIRSEGEDPYKFGKFLQEQGYLRDQRSIPTGFQARISVFGISQVNPEYLHERQNKIISTLGLNGGIQSAMEILDLEPKDYTKAKDVVEWLENQGLLGKPRYTADDIFIELSIEGRDYYDRNQATFI